MKKLLFIWPGPCFYNSIGGAQRRQMYFDRYYNCLIYGFAEEKFSKVAKVAGADFYWHLYHTNSLIRTIYSFIVLVKIVYLYHFKNKKFDVVISPNPLITGVMAVLISKLTGAKSIVEINGNFQTAFKYGATGNTSMSLFSMLKEKVSLEIMRMVIKNADRVKLLNEKQIAFLTQNDKAKVIIKAMTFPEYTSTEMFFKVPKTDKKYILFLGYPFYLKGVDVLILAFNDICNEFPDYKLKIVGWCPEGIEFFKTLANGNTKIEFLGSVIHEHVPEYVGNCSLLVLPSRSEAMGRVLIEAMACCKPVIGSDVDGIPTIIRHGYNGLLFKCGDYKDLAEKMRAVLKDKCVYSTLANNAFNYVKENLTEDAYIQKYKSMIDNLFV
jgi:glycosyltransferase involved in cell wall biosynthesis